MRTSYQVGRPWMLDGKMLRAATGTPMRRIARAKRPFADAEPEPLTFANLTTKSLTRTSGFTRASMSALLDRGGRACGDHLSRPPSAWAGAAPDASARDRRRARRRAVTS